MEKVVFVEATAVKTPVRELMTRIELDKKIENEKKVGNKVIIADGITKFIRGLADLDVLSVVMTRKSPLNILEVKKIENEKEFCDLLFGK